MYLNRQAVINIATVVWEFLHCLELGQAPKCKSDILASEFMSLSCKRKIGTVPVNLGHLDRTVLNLWAIYVTRTTLMCARKPGFLREETMGKICNKNWGNIIKT